jgi:hypothetical protein
MNLFEQFGIIAKKSDEFRVGLTKKLSTLFTLSELKEVAGLMLTMSFLYVVVMYVVYMSTTTFKLSPI